MKTTSMHFIPSIPSSERLPASALRKKWFFFNFLFFALSSRKDSSTLDISVFSVMNTVVPNSGASDCILKKVLDPLTAQHLFCNYEQRPLQSSTILKLTSSFAVWGVFFPVCANKFRLRFTSIGAKCTLGNIFNIAFIVWHLPFISPPLVNTALQSGIFFVKSDPTTSSSTSM